MTAPRTIASHWAEIQEKVLTSPDLTKQDIEELRGIFYAGAGRMFDSIIACLSDDDMPPSAFQQAIDGWDGELQRFVEGLNAKAANEGKDAPPVA